jgi:DNA repair exonuclease SbcCD ATPase subunit
MGRWSLTPDDRYFIEKDLRTIREKLEEKINELDKLVKRAKELEKKVHKESIEEMWKKVHKLEEDICNTFVDCWACPIACERYVKGYEEYCKRYNCRRCPHLRVCVSPFFTRMMLVSAWLVEEIVDDIKNVLERINMLMRAIENMIQSAEPETKNNLLYIYNEIEDIYNTLRGNERGLGLLEGAGEVKTERVKRRR